MFGMVRDSDYDKTVMTADGDPGTWTRNVLDGISRSSDTVSMGYINHPVLGRQSIDIPWEKLYGRNFLVSGGTGYGKSAFTGCARRKPRA